MVMMGLKLTGKLPFKEVSVLMCVFVYLFLYYILLINNNKYLIFGAPGATEFKNGQTAEVVSRMY